MDDSKEMNNQSMSKELNTIADNLSEQQLADSLVDYFHKINKTGTKIIALVGGPASGKGTLAETLVQTLGNAAYFSTDNYLKGDRVWRRANVENIGKDPIQKYDFEFLKEQIELIKNLKDGEELGVPVYDGTTGIAISANPEDRPDPDMYPKKVGHVDYLIVEGDFQPLGESVDSILYLDTPDDVRLENRIYRDLQERGESDKQKIIDNFNSRQKSQFLPHTLPWKEKANLVIGVKANLLSEPTTDRKYDYCFSIQQKVEK